MEINATLRIGAELAGSRLRVLCPRGSHRGGYQKMRVEIAQNSGALPGKELRHAIGGLAWPIRGGMPEVREKNDRQLHKTPSGRKWP